MKQHRRFITTCIIGGFWALLVLIGTIADGIGGFFLSFIFGAILTAIFAAIAILAICFVTQQDPVELFFDDKYRR